MSSDDDYGTILPSNFTHKGYTVEETKPVEPESTLLTYTDLQERPSDFDDIDALRKQLSRNPNVPPVDRERMLELFQCALLPFFVRRTREERRIIAMAELVVCDTAFESFGLIEEVVVDEKYRGRGIAKEMLWRIIRKAQLIGLHHIDLTSGPDRVEANQLYTTLGFQRRETNMYRIAVFRGTKTE